MPPPTPILRSQARHTHTGRAVSFKAAEPRGTEGGQGGRGAGIPWLALGPFRERRTKASSVVSMPFTVMLVSMPRPELAAPPAPVKK